MGISSSSDRRVRLPGVEQTPPDEGAEGMGRQGTTAVPTSRAHASGTMLERSRGSKPLSPGIVPSSAGAAGRKGIALDLSCDAEEGPRS